MKTCTMPVIETLVLRIREVAGVVHSGVRISAPVNLIQQMVTEFARRGETPVVGFDSVAFGPHILVYVDDDLPDATFRIAVLK